MCNHTGWPQAFTSATELWEKPFQWVHADNIDIRQTFITECMIFCYEYPLEHVPKKQRSWNLNTLYMSLWLREGKCAIETNTIKPRWLYTTQQASKASQRVTASCIGGRFIWRRGRFIWVGDRFLLSGGRSPGDGSSVEDAGRSLWGGSRYLQDGWSPSLNITHSQKIIKFMYILVTIITMAEPWNFRR